MRRWYARVPTLGARMKRRDLVSLLVRSAAAWPLVTSAQRTERMRRIGAHMNFAEGDPEAKPLVVAFEQALAGFGWVQGRNVTIDYRFTGGQAERIRVTARELVALAPDVILGSGGTHVGPLLQQTTTIPIVFVLVADPVGAGFVANLAQPGGNATGFTAFDYSIGAKWLDLLMQVAPATKRVAVLRDAANPSGTGLFGSIQTASSRFRIEVTPVGLRDAAEIERGVAGFARAGNGGMIVTPTSLAIVHRDLIIAQAQKFALPAIYPFRYFYIAGGLVHYGFNPVDQYRQAARYIDLVLRGEKPANLPVQNPTKYDLAINLKTARALGLVVPPALLAAATEVIE